MDKPTSVDDYLASVPDDARATLEGLRRVIRAIAPDAVEGMGYGIPGFKYKGRPLIYFGAARKHCALYGGTIGAYRGDLAGYDTSKGTLRFPIGEPPPDALVKALVTERMAEIDVELAARKSKKVGAAVSE